MRSLIGTLAARRVRNDSPVPLTSRRAAGIGGFFGSRNTSVSELSAMGSVGTLFAIVNRTSTSTAKVDWHLYRKAKSGKKEDRTEVTRHACIDLWNKPNPFMSRQQFVEIIQQHIDLVGEADWVVSTSSPCRTRSSSSPGTSTPAPTANRSRSTWTRSSS
jgi:phage portal protein BeeE